MRTKKKFKKLWIASVDIEAAPGYEFNDLIDCSECNETLPAYNGAWANVILQSENLYFLVEDNDVNVDIIKEAEWLYSSKFRFMISDKLWPYLND